MTRRVSYFYDQDVGSFVYGEGHPMRPFRINMTHQLILAYGLYRKMNVYQPNRASDQQMTVFHSQNYIEHLKRVAPNLLEQNQQPTAGGTQALCSSATQSEKFNVGENDCPWFPGLFEFSQISCGGSIDAAIKLNHRSSDLCINWAGGLHHAKKQQAKGFCYVNDIVLAILELLKYHQRVLYIDIDVHHGDGVEEAFFTTNRVMTVSFHRYGDFFPGTGDLRDIGEGEGKGYAVNVPLQPGLDDDSFVEIYKTIMEAVRIRFRPEVVVLQCGADSLAYDKLGTYNTTLRGHGACVKLVKEWGLPLMILGGGGYTIKNVARCWAYETGICLDQELENDLPLNDYYELLGNDKKLHFEARPDSKNDNTREYLEFIQAKCLNNINSLEHAPSVGITDFIAKDFYTAESIEAHKLQNPDNHNDLSDMNAGIVKTYY